MSKHYFNSHGKFFISRNNEQYETLNNLNLVLVKGNRNTIEINHLVKKLVITGNRNIITINARKIRKISLEGNNNKIYTSYSCKINDILDFGKRNKIFKRTNDEQNENDELQNSNSEEVEEEKEKEETNDNTQTNIGINNNSNESEDEDGDKNENEDEDEQNNGNIIIGGFGVISNGSLHNNNNHDVIRNFILSRIAHDLSKNNKNISEINNILNDLIEIPFKSSNKKTKEGNEKCVICYENFKEKEIVKMTSCFHIYHFNCIKRWIENKIELKENPDCPICRRKL